MIKSLKGKFAQRIWTRRPTKKMLAIYEMAYDCLALLHSITELEQLKKVPGLNLHNLIGNRSGQRAFSIGKTKYRVCFFWEKGNAYEVEIVDYH